MDNNNLDVHNVLCTLHFWLFIFWGYGISLDIGIRKSEFVTKLKSFLKIRCILSLRSNPFERAVWRVSLEIWSIIAHTSSSLNLASHDITQLIEIRVKWWMFVQTNTQTSNTHFKRKKSYIRPKILIWIQLRYIRFVKVNICLKGTKHF